jgi:uncharacterized protein
MTKLAKLAVLCLAWLALFAIAPREAFADKFVPPALQGYVVDGTGTLTQSQIADLNHRLDTFRKEKGYVVVAFVVPSLDGRPIEDVAYDTFNTWQVGDKDKDNGALLVIAPNERRIRIETGKGVGGELTDLESVEILRNQVTPPLRDGDLYRAIDQGTQAMATALAGDLPTRPEPAAPDEGSRSPFGSFGMILLVGLLILLSIIFPPFRLVLFALLSGFRGGGGGGGGGFSSGGGGGRSGGGGASESY